MPSVSVCGAPVLAGGRRLRGTCRWVLLLLTLPCLPEAEPASALGVVPLGLAHSRARSGLRIYEADAVHALGAKVQKCEVQGVSLSGRAGCGSHSDGLLRQALGLAAQRFMVDESRFSAEGLSSDGSEDARMYDVPFSQSSNPSIGMGNCPSSGERPSHDSGGVDRDSECAVCGSQDVTFGVLNDKGMGEEPLVQNSLT